MRKLITLAAVLLTISAYAHTIRVLIVDQVDEASVEITGSYQISDPNKEAALSRGLFGKKYPLRVIPGGLAWGEEYPSTYQISISPEHTHANFVVDGVPYRGVLRAYNIEGKLSIVNEVSLEDYTRSVLGSEVTKETPLEMLAAMAITTRTHAHFDTERRKKAQFHVVAEDVGYKGELPSRYTADIKKAVQQTERIVLEMNDGTFPAVYTIDCAGTTAPHHRIFRADAVAPTTAIRSPYAERHRSESAWKSTLTCDQLATHLGLHHINGISLLVDPESHKVSMVQVQMDDEMHEFDFLSFQDKIGEDRIRSSEFSVTTAASEVTFSGHGEGHGVGICLYTAERMATRGDKASDILSTFYPEARISLLSPEAPPARKTLARRYPRRFRAA